MNKYKDELSLCGIPDYMHEGIIRYIEKGVVPGGFLTAVLNNDLREAFHHADSTNINCIKNYMVFFYMNAPTHCWGYAGAVNYWSKFKGESHE